MRDYVGAAGWLAAGSTTGERESWIGNDSARQQYRVLGISKSRLVHNRVDIRKDRLC
jgi:hypothetical protein